MNREQSVIDDIDALVDEQMAGGEPLGGYDYNDPDYPKCPHCHRDWHGLAITERIEQMAARYTMDAHYRHAEDDSPVLCPGSEFIGPVASPSQLARIRHPGNRGIVLSGFFEPLRGQPWVTWFGLGAIDDALADGSTSRDHPYRDAPIINDGARVAFIGSNGNRYEGIARLGETDPRRPWLTQQTIHIDQLVESPNEGRGATGGPVIHAEVIDPVRRAQNRIATVQEQMRDVLRDMGLGLDTGPLRPADEYTIRPGSWILETHTFPAGDLERAVQTPQQRALPRPSTQPPMWANDPSRTRRTRNRSSITRTPRI